MSASRPRLLPAVCLALTVVACSSPDTNGSGPVVYFPPEPDAPRLQFLRSVSFDVDVIEPRSGLDTMLFGEQEAGRMIQTPYGVTFHEGVFYVADLVLGFVVTLDLANREFDAVRITGRNAPVKPVNIAFSPDGRMFVADLSRRQVLVYDGNDQLVAELGPFSEDSRPSDVDVFGDRLYITDSGDPKVRVHDLRTLEELFTFGREGEDPEKMIRGPANLAHDSQGNSYVSDAIRLRIAVFSPEGEWLRNIGRVGDAPGTFSRPKGIAIHDDLLYVVDAAFENCQILDLEGTPVAFFGGSGIERGQFYLPSGVWVGAEAVELFREYIAEGFEAEAIVVVTNFYGPHKVSFFALGKHRDYDYSIYERPPVPAEAEPGSQDESASGD